MSQGRAKYRWLQVAAVAALLALGLMFWSYVDGRPIVLVAAMSVGQGLGTLSLLVFLGVVASELRLGQVLHPRGRGKPPRGR